MAKKIIWLKNAEIQMFSIMGYYQERNKSKIYSEKLYREITQKIKKLDSKVAFPQKTSIKNLYYFTHKHISVFFSITKTEIIVKLIWDERRNPQNLNSNLEEID